MFTGSGKLGLPENALLAFAVGSDARRASRPSRPGCSAAWSRARRRAPGHYVAGLRAELLRLARACGVAHPTLVTPDRIELLDGERMASAAERFGYRPGWGLPHEDRAALAGLMREQARERPEAPPQRIPTRPGEVPRVP